MEKVGCVKLWIWMGILEWVYTWWHGGPWLVTGSELLNDSFQLWFILANPTCEQDLYGHQLCTQDVSNCRTQADQVGRMGFCKPYFLSSVRGIGPPTHVFTKGKLLKTHLIPSHIGVTQRTINAKDDIGRCGEWRRASSIRGYIICCQLQLIKTCTSVAEWWQEEHTLASS